MDYMLIASEIETRAFSDSAVHKYMGSNVKSPGLVRGTYYIIKFWSFKSLSEGSDNQFWLGQFVGAGASPENILPDTPRAKEMPSNQYYFFKRPDGQFVAAGNFNGALVVNNDNEQRITFYALLGEAQQDALPLTQPAVRPDKTRAVEPAKVPHERVQKRPVERVKREARDPQAAALFTESMRSLFVKSPDPVYREFLVAQFSTESEARSFASILVEGIYVEEAFAHQARSPQNLNDTPEFIRRAKEQGAVSYHIRRVQVNR